MLAGEKAELMVLMWAGCLVAWLVDNLVDNLVDATVVQTVVVLVAQWAAQWAALMAENSVASWVVWMAEPRGWKTVDRSAVHWADLKAD